MTTQVQMQTQIQLLSEPVHVEPLEQRFADLKQRFVKPEHKQKLIQSYSKLLQTLEDEVRLIEKRGPAMIPEIDFNEVRAAGGALPADFADLVRERGCVVLRNVVPEAEAVAWEAQIKDYTSRHPGVGGYPRHKPASWSVWWTEAQVQIRSHPAVLEAMKTMSTLWHSSDPDAPIDFSSQVVYPDRCRIRYPSVEPDLYTLAAHLDSGSVERWEDDENRRNFAAIFEGDWDKWDGWDADHRIHAKSDLYNTGTSCSAWRSLQAWLSLSHTNTGEGTIRLLPSLKASVAYIMLRPLFHSGVFDDSTATFPSAKPGSNQLYPSPEHYPHLQMDRAMVGIPPVKPGDYVFWHCDLVHEVDKVHPGERDSSVVYNSCNPLTPYNIDSLVSTRDSFLKADVPRDFRTFQDALEREYEHEDHGARKENILSKDGMRAMGFEKFDVDEPGLSDGQRAVRKMANEKLGLA